MGIDHGGFQVSDMTKAIEFYTKKLGFNLLFRKTNADVREEYAFLEYHGARVELIMDLDGEYTKPALTKHLCPHFCLEAADLNLVVDMLNLNGVEIIGGPHFVEGEETWLYIKDDDNNVLEYIQWLH
jgi:catechol 2,3-dioxygenase-like lactoylglutathione lyase family enzyme